MARKQIRVFSKSYPIIVPSGSCAGMMKHHYPLLFAGTPEEDAAHRFADRVYEWSEYLVKVLNIKLEDRGAPITITWHSSCHALREMDVIQYAKALIRQLKNVTLVELQREDGMLRVRRHLCRQTAGHIGRHGPRQSGRYPSYRRDDAGGWRLWVYDEHHGRYGPRRRGGRR